MSGSATALRQERLKKSARTNPLGLFTINEEDEQQKNENSKRLKGMLRFCSMTGAVCEIRRTAGTVSVFISSSVCYSESVCD